MEMLLQMGVAKRQIFSNQDNRTILANLQWCDGLFSLGNSTYGQFLSFGSERSVCILFCEGGRLGSEVA